MNIRPTARRRAAGNRCIARTVGRARPTARHLRLSSGCRPYAIGLSGAIRFMLLTPLSPMSACVSGIAAPVLTHPGRCRFLFQIRLRQASPTEAH